MSPTKRSNNVSLYDMNDCSINTVVPLEDSSNDAIVVSSGPVSPASRDNISAGKPSTSTNNGGSPVSEPGCGEVGDIIDGGGGSSSSDRATTVSELECTETDIQTFHVTLTYKPRI